MVRIVNELTPNPEPSLPLSLSMPHLRAPYKRECLCLPGSKVQIQSWAIIDTVKQYHFNGRKCAAKSKGIQEGLAPE